MTKKTILIVDDEPHIAESLSLFIQMSGYNTIQALSGEEALEIVKRDDPRIDFVITDVIMPEMSGKELLIEIKKYNPDIPIVLLMSGHSDLTPDLAKKNGAIDLLSKPLDYDHILKVLEHYLS